MSESFTRRYRLLDRIAIGGTAEVFHALYVGEHGAGEKPVVVKRVLPQLARDERFRRLFFEEACLAATLSHPNVVKVLDYGDLGNTCFIAMERIVGQDLESLLAAARACQSEQAIAPALAALIAVGVGDALQFIHQHTSSEGLPLQIIHRDVSPHNILVSYQGDVKLTDFGIAKSVIRRDHTVDGTLRGKLEYMAPEQAVPEQTVDHRADIFALGCVLYEMLQGHPPLRGSSELDTLQRVRDVRLDVPPERLAAPAPLRELLSRTLRADPADRYAHAGEAVADLRAYLESCPSTPTRDDLAAWALGLRDGDQSPGEESPVDDAVRALLGGSPVERPEAPIKIESPGRPLSTSIFALPADEPRPSESSPQPAGPAKPPPLPLSVRPAARDRPQWRFIVPLALFALLGWGLWALRLADDRSSRRATDIGVAHEPAEPSAAPAPPAKTGGKTRTRKKRRSRRPARRRASGDRQPAKQDSPAAQRADDGQGYLTVNSLPWSRVYLDGHYVGNTPLIRHETRTGPHRVQLRDAKGKLRKSFHATVRRGHTDRFTFDFRPAAKQRGRP